MIKPLPYLIISLFLAHAAIVLGQSQESDFDALEKLICSKLELDSVRPYLHPTQYGFPYQLKGDFKGDGFDDIVILLRVPNDQVKLILVDYSSTETEVSYVYEAIDDYAFAGHFSMTASEDTLWSNWDDSEDDLGWLTFEEAPIEKQVILGYNAIFVHEAEACGGGFIFWHEGQWKWLQQE